MFIHVGDYVLKIEDIIAVHPPEIIDVGDGEWQIVVSVDHVDHDEDEDPYEFCIESTTNSEESEECETATIMFWNIVKQLTNAGVKLIKYGDIHIVAKHIKEVKKLWTTAANTGIWQYSIKTVDPDVTFGNNGKKNDANFMKSYNKLIKQFDV